MNSSEVERLHIWSVKAEMDNPACAKEMAELRKMIAGMKGCDLSGYYRNGLMNQGINPNWYNAAAQRALSGLQHGQSLRASDSVRQPKYSLPFRIF